jgi:hypothetical protein
MVELHPVAVSRIGATQLMSAMVHHYLRETGIFIQSAYVTVADAMCRIKKRCYMLQSIN